MVKKKRSPSRKAKAPMVLQYKVAELSNVDEGTVERTINEWVAKGWTFDGLQFAMRESSKRPAMAFVFFTRHVLAAADGASENDRFRSESEADRHLRRLVVGPDAPEAGEPQRVDAWTRLAQLAGDEEA